MPTGSYQTQATVDDHAAISLPFTVGQYIATEILAKGGMSTTYLGYSANDDSQKVVIKIPDTSSPRTVELFENECKILTELHHPNIVPVLKTGAFCAGLPYMVMKYIAGQSLRQKIDTQGKFSWSDTVDLLDDIAGALQYLFEKDFCHRDIKPANIVFDTDTKHWILVDFGIAKSMQNNIMATMTLAGQGSGTWDYMPPEQLEGKVVDIRCDIYALGTVAWEALIGRLPHRGTKLPSALRRDLPTDVDVLIAKMVEHNQEDRYQTPAEVLQALHGGAKKIEALIHLKRNLKKALKYVAWSLCITCLLGLMWITSDFFVNAKIHEIQETNKNSATVTIREIEKYISRTPLWLGRRYWASIETDLRTKANEEKRKMEDEYSTIKERIGLTEGEDADLENRKTLCENFVSKWGNIFGNTSELKYAAQQRDVLGNILRHRSEKKRLDEIIAETKTITIECEKEKANFRRAISDCNQFESELHFDDLKQQLHAFVAELKKQAIDNALALADSKCADGGSGDNLFKAYQTLFEVKEYAGDDERLHTKMSEIDDSFWNYYLAKVQEELNKNHFKNARSYAEHYGRLGKPLGMTRNLSKADEVLKIIADAEETYDWNETVKVANKYLDDRAFPSAFDAVLRFEKKYPHTKIDIAKARKTIADRFASDIISTQRSLDDCQDQLETFIKLFSMQNDNIPALQRHLCFCVFEEIETIMFGDSSAKTEQLAQIKFTKCNDVQKQYLSSLKSVAMDSAANPGDKFKWYTFFYRYERPPESCVKLSEPPRIYWVTITSFSYSMSKSDYDEYKGIGDADIQVKIQENTADEPFKINAPTNRREWSTSTTSSGNEIAFWFDTKGAALTAGIVDDDTFDRGPSRLVDFGASQFSRSGEASYSFDSGTKISIKWTTE